MSVRFYLYAGERWRELNTASGRVEGWGSDQCQFVSLRRGRLKRVRPAEVLRELRALAAGRPTSAHYGPQLSHIRNSRHVADAKRRNDNESRHNSCRQSKCHSNTDAIFDRILYQPVTSNVGTTTISTNTIGIQCTIADAVREPYGAKHNTSAQVLRITQTNDESPKKRGLEKRRRSNDRDKVHKKQKTGRIHDINVASSTSEGSAKPQNREDQSVKALDIGEDEVLLIRSLIEQDDRNIFGVDLEKFDSSNHYKRIVCYKLNPLVNIERNRYIDMMNKNNADNLSMKDFMSQLGLQSLEEASTASNRYRMRSRASHPAAQDCESNKENTSKPNPHRRKQPKSSVRKKNKNRQLNSESDDEVVESTQRVMRKRPSTNRSSRREKERRPAPVEAQVTVNDTVELSSDSEDRESGMTEVQGKNLRGKAVKDVAAVAKTRTARGARRGPREYSPAEDAALLGLVRTGSRARLVNGNWLWKEMEGEYQRATGIYRSWHSLRNRYLRYVLPSLGSSSMPLPPTEAVRLRSDAALGKLKNRKLQPQYNSLLNNNNNKVISAWSRRPRSPLRESPSPSPSSPHSLPPPRPTDRNDPSFSTSWKTSKQIRENIINSKSGKRSLRSRRHFGATAPRSRTPTYSELTRRFVMKHSTPNSAAVIPNTPNTRQSERRGKHVQTGSSESSLRQSSSSSSEEQDSSDERHKSLLSHKGPPRTRRLYNPRAL